MSERKRYRKKKMSTVTAVQFDLDTEGFTYQKWGGTQTCKKGDWLVNNNGDIYTIDQKVFEKTYTETSPGIYFKDAPVWAVVADGDGCVKTIEGETNYKAGDYLVSNDVTGADSYAVSRKKFEDMYELIK